MESSLERIINPFLNRKIVRFSHVDDTLFLWFKGGEGLMFYNNEQGSACIAQTENKLQ